MKKILAGLLGIIFFATVANAWVWRSMPDGSFQVYQRTAGSGLVITANNNIGIGTTDINYDLDVSGTINATAFRGDGSGLTNISANAVPSNFITQNYSSAVTLSNSSNSFTGDLTGDVVGDLTGTADAASLAITSNYSLDSDKLDAQEGSYYLDGSNINAGTVAQAYLPSDIITGNVASPTTDEVLKWNGASWVNGPPAATSAGDGVTYYFNDTLVGTSNYYELLKQPTDLPEETDTATASAGVTNSIESYMTSPNGLGTTSIEAGAWDFNIYAYVNSAVGDSRINIDVYSRTIGGVETFLFTVQTDEINSLTAALYEIISVQPAFVISSTDRIVTKLWFEASSGVEKTVSFLHNGTEHYSHIHTPLVTRHNELAGLQGGSGDEYYHFTSAEHGYYSGANAQSVLTTATPTFSGVIVTTLSATNLGSDLDGAGYGLIIDDVTVNSKLFVTTNLTIGEYIMPIVDGTNTYVLKTNGSGTVSWQPDSTSGTAITHSIVIDPVYLHDTRTPGTGQLSTSTIEYLSFDSGASQNIKFQTEVPGWQDGITTINLVVTYTTSGNANSTTISYTVGYDMVAAGETLNDAYTTLSATMAPTGNAGIKFVERIPLAPATDGDSLQVYFERGLVDGYAGQLWTLNFEVEYKRNE